MKRLVYLSLVLLIYSCSTGPQIIRKMIPLEDKEVFMNIDKDKVSQENDGVKITIEYMNRKKLYEIAKENNPYVDSEGGPILTTFKIIIENRRDTKIKFEPENSVLLDGLGNQFNALTYEAFKELYPSSVYQQYEYSFIFNRYYIETYYTDDYHKRQKAAKSLFKGGNIYPGVKVEGILPFQRISEYAKDVTLILPDIILYRVDANKVETEEDRRIEFKFKFKQKIVRLD